MRLPCTYPPIYYAAWSMQIWRWIAGSSMIGPDHLVLNGLDYQGDCKAGGTTWTYNQGVMIGALVKYWHLTKEDIYLAQAEAIADAVLTTLIHPNGVLREPHEAESNGDQIQFKGIFMRYLYDLYAVTNHQRYADFILHNADALWLHSRDEATDQIGTSWASPFDTGSAARQSSGIDALLVAVLVGRE